MATDHPQNRNKLLNHVLDEIARDTPSKVFAEIPKSMNSFADGFRKVTYGELSNAVNGFAAHLENAIGKGTSSETLAYVGVQDLRYVILLLGAVKAGYNMLLFSPRFPPLAAANLFKQTSVKTILVSNPRLPFLAPIIEQYPMNEVEVPGLDTLLDSHYPNYPYEVTFEESRMQTLVTLHTSGTTGFPKPIKITHEWVASFAEELYLEPPEGYESTTKNLLGTKLFSQFPFFHLSFVMGYVIFPLLTGTLQVYPLAALPPSVQMVVDFFEHNEVDMLCSIPSIIDQIYRDPDLLARISSKVGRMLYSGGDISTEAGDTLSLKVKLINQMGGTEVGIFHNIAPIGTSGGQNWHYLGFHPSSNVHFVQREGDICEAVVRRKEGPGYTQTIFRVFPHAQEYATGDLYKPHPTEPGLWKYEGRIDEMIVFASGEKFWPVQVEKMIKQHPDVREAVIIGTGRHRAALLLEPESTLDVPSEGMIDRVWPIIEATQEICSQAAKICKELIIVTDPKRPMARTAKGNVQRAATTQLYSDDLDRLYKEAAEKVGAVSATGAEILVNNV